MTAAGDWGAVPYCKGEVCRNGIFNFMASNMAWDEKRDATGNSWLEDRFGPPKDSYMPPGYDKTPELIAKDALDVGTSIMNNRSKYRSPEDPYDVPFYWGYRTESDGRTMAGVWNFHWTINYAPLRVH